MPSGPSSGDLACSLRNARNSAGAISGCKLAGTQKRWRGSSAGLLGARVVNDSSLWSSESPPSVDDVGDQTALGKSGSMARAPGVVERRRRSLRASTSRWISYSDGCRARAAIAAEAEWWWEMRA